MAQRFEKNDELIKWAYENLEGIPRGSDNYERLISGMVYKSWAWELKGAQALRHELARRYSEIYLEDKTEEEFMKERHDHIKKIFGYVADKAYMEPPFNVDYGFNTYISEGFYANFNLTILDGSIVKIGKHCMIGPNVTITCDTHHLDQHLRAEVIPVVQWAREIEIGDNVWIGAGAVVCQGTKIGNGVIIGANAVVSAGSIIPDNCAIGGVPAKIIKKLPGFKEGDEIKRDI